MVNIDTYGFCSYPGFINSLSLGKNYHKSVPNPLKIIKNMQSDPRIPNRPRMNQDNVSLFHDAISYSRIKAYKDIAAKCDINWIYFYLWNIAISEAIYPAINNFEVALRNHLNLVVSELDGEKEWLEKWEKEYNEAKNNAYDKDIDRIKKAKQELEDNGKNISQDNLIPQLSLGFWVSLTSRRYEQKRQDIYPKDIYPKVFRLKTKLNRNLFLPQLENKNRTREYIYTRFYKIYKLRNKIAHHEMIIDKSHNSVKKTREEINKDHRDIVEAIRWMSPHLSKITEKLSRLPDILENGPCNYIEKVGNYPNKDSLKEIEEIIQELSMYNSHE